MTGMAMKYGILSIALMWLCLAAPGCGSSSAEGAVLFVDAEFDPVAPADQDAGVSENQPGVAQTFTVLSTGKFEEFWIVLVDGPSVDDGTVRITVRPVVGGVPDASPSSSIIRPIDVDTSTLPGGATETFSEFNVGNDPGRQVVAGEMYAIVVEFVDRGTGVETGAAIANIRGIDRGNPFTGGNAAEDPGTGYVVNADMDDYIFRTFILR